MFTGAKRHGRLSTVDRVEFDFAASVYRALEIGYFQWRNLSAAAPANAGGPEGPEGAHKDGVPNYERLVNIECKTLKRVVFTSDIQAWA